MYTIKDVALLGFTHALSYKECQKIAEDNNLILLESYFQLVTTIFEVGAELNARKMYDLEEKILNLI